MEYTGNRLEGSHYDFQWQKIDLPRVVVIQLQDKFKVSMNNEQKTFTLSYDAEARNYMAHFGSRHARVCVNKIFKCIIYTVLQNLDNKDNIPDGMHTTTQVQFSSWILQMSFASGNSGC